MTWSPRCLSGRRKEMIERTEELTRLFRRYENNVKELLRAMPDGVVMEIYFDE